MSNKFTWLGNGSEILWRNYNFERGKTYPPRSTKDYINWRTIIRNIFNKLQNIEKSGIYYLLLIQGGRNEKI